MDATQYYSSVSVPPSPLKQSTTYAEEHIRRTKKTPVGPYADGAGLVCGTRYGGVRTTPLKGKGCPPPDQKFDTRFDLPQEFVPSRRTYHHHHQAKGDSKDKVQHGNSTRYDQSFKSSIRYSQFGVVSDADLPRRPASALPTSRAAVDTKERIMVRDARAQVDDDLNVRAIQRGQKAWKEQESLVLAAREEEARKALARPQTAAPPSEARRMALQQSYSNQDVFRYRYSGGICPEEYKFHSSRPNPPKAPAPVERPSTARETFVNARTSFSINRAKAMSSVGIY